MLINNMMQVQSVLCGPRTRSECQSR